ncbi:MAG: TIGR01212 family radical SAM protein [Bacteroidales bacterium]|nr:TIGR01212 family radical SAM protein [Bacteroidales bacterium]
MTYSWGHNRRINAASNYLKKKFGERIQKVTIDAGFTCPNRDGTISTGGCAYCNNNAFNPAYCNPGKSITLQMEEGIAFHEKRYKNAGSYFAYFQAYSNTYASINILKSFYEEALAHKKVTGLIIGTRPDCIDDEKLEYLTLLSEKYYVVIEYGIESVYDETLNYINRGHDFESAVKALELTKKYGVKSGAHIIFGLPGETRKQMAESVEIISKLPLHTVKFHQLQIIKDTRFEKEYIQHPEKFDLFSFKNYIEFISEYISKLNPEFIIERVAGETQPRNNLGLTWGLRYDQVLKQVEEELKRRDFWQGKFYKN